MKQKRDKDWGMCFKVNLQDHMTGEVDGDTMLGTLLAEVRSEWRTRR